MANRKGAFVYRDAMSRHVLRDDHVFKPVRLRYTYELLDDFGAFEVENGRLVDPRHATDEEVQTFHTPDYAAAVKSFGEGRMLVDPGPIQLQPVRRQPHLSRNVRCSDLGSRRVPAGGGHDS